jgi:hypothetical protein
VRHFNQAFHDGVYVFGQLLSKPTIGSNVHEPAVHNVNGTPIDLDSWFRSVVSEDRRYRVINNMAAAAIFVTDTITNSGETIIL